MKYKNDTSQLIFEFKKMLKSPKKVKSPKKKSPKKVKSPRKKVVKSILKKKTTKKSVKKSKVLRFKFCDCGK